MLKNKICIGEFCELGRSLDPDIDLVPAGNQDEIQYDRENERAQDRDRVARIARRILSETEMIHLEESGNIIQLRSTRKVNPKNYEPIKVESIKLAKKEHRLALLELFNAEKKGLIPIEEWKSYLGAVCDSNDCNCHQVHNHTFYKQRDIGRSHNQHVNVCGICAQAYKILDQAREILSEESDKTVTSETESIPPVLDDGTQIMRHDQKCRNESTTYTTNAFSNLQLKRGNKIDNSSQNVKSMTVLVNKKVEGKNSCNMSYNNLNNYHWTEKSKKLSPSTKQFVHSNRVLLVMNDEVSVWRVYI